MLRYLRLYAYFVRFSVSRSLEFRMDFFFRVIMDLIFYLANLGFFRVLFLHSHTLGGWNESQAMIFVAGYLVVDALIMTLFSNNMWMLPFYVNRGDLDYYLVRPVSSQFFLSLRDFALNSFINLLMALGILGWAVARSSESYGLGAIIGFCVLLFLGSVMHYLMHLLFLLPVFWTHSGRGFGMLFWSFTRISERPDRIFKGGVRLVLVTVLPLALMSSYPARLFLEPWDWRVLGHFLGVLVLFFMACRMLWKFALRSYSSASS